MTGLTEARAALERGRHVVWVLPPAVEQAGVVWDLVPAGPGVVIVCADPAAAADWADAFPERRVHAVTGLARASRLLAAGRAPVLAGAAKDLAALLGRSALKLDTAATIVVAWPETLPAGGGALLDTLLGEAKDVARLILTWNPGQLSEFLERHAYRAPVFGAAPADAEGRPPGPVGPAGFAVVPASRRLDAVRDALDALDPPRAFVWAPTERVAARFRERFDPGSVTVGVQPPDEPFDAVLCAALPTREQFAALSKIAEPVVLAAPGQLAYLRALAAPLKPLRLPTAADRARDRTEALRERVAQRVDAGPLDSELALLDPLFARFDPAEVAAALLALSQDARGAAPAAEPAPAGSAWVKVFVNVGRKDRAAAKDLVGALIREVGLAKEAIGRIEVRETFSVVEVAAAAADRAIRGLGGVVIRGRRAQARLDRHA